MLSSRSLVWIRRFVSDSHSWKEMRRSSTQSSRRRVVWGVGGVLAVGIWMHWAPETSSSSSSSSSSLSSSCVASASIASTTVETHSHEASTMSSRSPISLFSLYAPFTSSHFPSLNPFSSSDSPLTEVREKLRRWKQGRQSRLEKKERWLQRERERLEHQLYELQQKHAEETPSAVSSDASSMESSCDCNQRDEAKPEIRDRFRRIWYKEKAVLFDTARTLLVVSCALICRFFLQVVNTTEMHNMEVFHRALNDRPANLGLVTISNHASGVDDPALLAVLAPFTYVMDSRKVRWAMCAEDRCFNKGKLVAEVFSTMKVLPVRRGAGLHHKFMEDAVHKLDSGDWIHIFPEGTRSSDRRLLPIKPGIAKLVSAAQKCPVVLPFYHVNMDQVLPRGVSFPRCGKTVHVLVGDPIDFSALLASHRSGEISDRELYHNIIAEIESSLQRLQRMAIDRGWMEDPYSLETTVSPAASSSSSSSTTT